MYILFDTNITCITFKIARQIPKLTIARND